MEVWYFKFEGIHFPLHISAGGTVDFYSAHNWKIKFECRFLSDQAELCGGINKPHALNGLSDGLAFFLELIGNVWGHVKNNPNPKPCVVNHFIGGTRS